MRPLMYVLHPCREEDVGQWLYLVTETVRQSLAYIPNSADYRLLADLSSELVIEAPEESDYRTVDCFLGKHFVSLETKGVFWGFKVEVRTNSNAPFNGIFLFAKELVSLVAYLNKNVLLRPYTSSLLTRFSGYASQIKEVRQPKPFGKCFY